MSDERKRNARLQGKFSDPKESRSGRRDKQSEKKNSTNSENSEDNKKSKSRASGGVNVEYQENSKHSFSELSEKKRIQEIRDRGTHELSETENGLSRIIYEPYFLSEDEASELFIILRDSTEWYDKDIIIHGQEYPQPRLVSWFGPFPYSYSGTTLDPAAMPSVILRIKEKVEAALKMLDLHVNLNSVLLNLYRNGKDSVAWHSDDEYSMGVQPTIASVSLGEVRAFQMRPKAHVTTIDPETRFQVNLLNGSLLVMDGCMQKDWLHQVPKEYHDKQPRINLTFRTVYRIDKIPTEVPYSIPEPAETVHMPTLSQPKHVYDFESFPPLGLASNPKSEVSNKTSPGSQNSSRHKKGVTVDNTKVVTENESAIDSIEDDKNPAIETSFNSKESSMNELVNKENSKDVAEPKPLEEESLSNEDEVVNSCKNDLEEVNEAVCMGGNKHKLNVNASEFVPIGHFSETAYSPLSFKASSLRDLADHYSKYTDECCESEEFVSALIGGLEETHKNRDFPIRDWIELEMYIKLIEGGQNSENQKLIIKRIFSIINNSNKYHPRKNMPPRTPRARNNFRGNSYRLH